MKMLENGSIRKDMSSWARRTHWTWMVVEVNKPLTFSPFCSSHLHNLLHFFPSDRRIGKLNYSELSGWSISCWLKLFSDTSVYSNKKVIILKDFSVLNFAKRVRKMRFLLCGVKCLQNKHLPIKPHQTSFTVNGKTRGQFRKRCHPSARNPILEINYLGGVALQLA